MTMFSNKMFLKMIFFVVSTLIAFTMGDKVELEILQSNGAFSNKLYKLLANEGENLIFSPISVHEVLAMSYIGAGGSTIQAYATALHLPDQTATAEGYNQIATTLNNVPNVTLLVANKVYVNEGHKLKKDFETALVNKFHSEVQSLNFKENSEAAKIINNWVEEKTKGKIQDLIQADSLDALTRLVLVNAIYFKGNWKHKFDQEATRTEPFYLNEKDTVDVQMMHLKKKFNFKICDTLNAKLIELPYTNEDISLVVILPNEKDGIQDLEKKLEKTDLTKITDEMYSTEVELALPKFKIEATLDLEGPLKELGLKEIFDQSKADFSNMIEGDEKLYVSKVVQKAFIEVNEEGAEAAAATGFIIQTLSASLGEYFLVDRPFVVLLKYKKVILFNGKIVHPISGDGSMAPRGQPVKNPFAHNIYIKLEE